MTFFTTLEIAASILSAAFFGVIFAVLDTILRILSLELNHIAKIKEQVFDSERLLGIPKREMSHGKEKGSKPKALGDLAAFFKVTSFAVGFILLSYYALDGAIRVYLLLFAIMFFLLFRYASNASLLKIADSVFLFVYGIFIIFLRLILKPLAALFYQIRKRLFKRRGK